MKTIRTAHSAGADATRAGRRMALILACLGLLSLIARADDSSGSSYDSSSQTNAATGDATASASSTAGIEPPPASPYGGADLHARLRVEYEYRTQGSYNDSDVSAYFYGSGRDLKGGHLDFYTSLRLHSDFDSPPSSSFADDPYAGLDDTDGVTENRVMQLYFDLHDQRKRISLRGGRQYIDIADYIQLDGAQVSLFEREKLGGRVYFGVPVSYYSSYSGNRAGGVSMIGRPWENNQTRFTYAHYHEDGVDDADQNYYLDTRQNLTEQIRLRGQMSVLNSDFRFGRFDTFYVSADGETDFSLGGSHWGSFDANTVAYSPLYSVLGSQQPYTFAYARLTQQITPKFVLSPGALLRFAESGDNDYNNRDYQNYDLTFVYERTKSFNASIALEYWEVQDADSFVGMSGEMRYRRQRIWEVSGGASYAQYTYDTFSDITYTINGGQTVFSENGTVIEESPFVKTYFMRAKWKVAKKLTLRFQFDIEDDDTVSDLAYRGRGAVEVQY